MIYRVLHNLSTGQVPGDVVPGRAFREEAVAILVRKGALSPVSAPPLAELPGWTLRAKRFEEAEIDAVGLLEMSDEEAALAIGSQPRAVARWRKELHEWLGIKEAQPRQDGCCGA